MAKNAQTEAKVEEGVFTRFRATFLLDNPDGVGFTFSVEGTTPDALDDAQTLASEYIKAGFKPYSRNGGGAKVVSSGGASGGGGGGGDRKPCPVHEGEYLYFKSGKFGDFWSHKNRDGNGWCKGR